MPVTSCVRDTLWLRIVPDDFATCLCHGDPHFWPRFGPLFGTPRTWSLGAHTLKAVLLSLVPLGDPLRDPHFGPPAGHVAQCDHSCPRNQAERSAWLRGHVGPIRVWDPVFGDPRTGSLRVHPLKQWSDGPSREKRPKKGPKTPCVQWLGQRKQSFVHVGANRVWCTPGNSGSTNLAGWGPKWAPEPLFGDKALPTGALALPDTSRIWTHFLAPNLLAPGPESGPSGQNKEAARLSQTRVRH